MISHPDNFSRCDRFGKGQHLAGGASTMPMVMKTRENQS